MEMLTEPSTGALLVGVYYLTLLGLGLVCLGTILWRSPKWRAMRRPPGPWKIGGIDFILFFSLVLVAWAISSLVADPLARLFVAPAPDNPEYVGLLGGLSAVFMQAGFIILFVFWRDLHRNEQEGPLNPRPLGPAALGREALLFLAAAYPLVVAASLGSQALFDALEAVVWDLDVEEQLVVELFRQIESPWILALFAFAAVFMAPLGEELIFRAGLYRFLLGPIGKPSAMLVSGLIFGSIHLNLAGLAPLTVLGIFLCVAYDLTGNIRVPIFMHMLFNAHTVFFLLAFPEAMPPM